MYTHHGLLQRLVTAMDALKEAENAAADFADHSVIPGETVGRQIRAHYEATKAARLLYEALAESEDDDE